jgi:hypothetical protein
MSRIDWTWEDIDASELMGSPDNGSLALPNGDLLRWVSVHGNRRFFIGNECIYDPIETDKLSVMAALAVEDVLTVLENGSDNVN